MAQVNNSNETFKSNYPTAPDGVVRTDAPDKKHPLVSGSAAGPGVSRAIDVGGADTNAAGVNNRSDKKIV